MVVVDDVVDDVAVSGGVETVAVVGSVPVGAVVTVPSVGEPDPPTAMTFSGPATQAEATSAEATRSGTRRRIAGSVGRARDCEVSSGRVPVDAR